MSVYIRICPLQDPRSVIFELFFPLHISTSYFSSHFHCVLENQGYSLVFYEKEDI